MTDEAGGYYVEESAVPMKLCDLCKELNVGVLRHIHLVKHYKHHPTFVALSAAASSGCELCTLFLRSVTETRAVERNGSVEDAHEELSQCARQSSCNPGCVISSVVEGPQRLESIIFRVPHTATLRYQRRGVFSYLDFAPYETQCKFDLRGLPGLTESISRDEGVPFLEIHPFPDYSVPKDWIQHCLLHHPTCSQQQDDPILPTRVIEISNDNTHDARLLISQGRKGQYVALSHCWGASRPLVTETSSLEQHQRSISLLSMPQTFRDAVEATRGLGYRYLWIDSICIVQDSAGDWQSECAKMGAIYQNAIVTICGPAASDSDAGFLHRRPAIHGKPYVWEYQNSEDEPPQRVTLRRRREHDSEKSLPTRTVQEKLSPLDKRGWILQERMLSRRILYFGTTRMFFECDTDRKFEDFQGNWKTWVYSGPYDPYATLKSEVRVSNSRESRSVLWHWIIEEYTKRALTNPTDKLPALSGLANSFWDGSQEIYLAGLLNGGLHDDLCWYVDSEPDGFAELASIPYRGPSWSWVSTDRTVRFCQPSFHVERLHPGNSLEILDAVVDTVGHDPFGQVRSASLRVRGPVMVGLVRRSMAKPDLSMKESHNGAGWFYVCGADSEIISVRDPTYQPDNPLECSLPFWDGSSRESRGALAYETSVTCIRIYGAGRWATHAMAIEALPDEESKYRRIGLITYLPTNWFEGAPIKEIEIV